MAKLRSMSTTIELQPWDAGPMSAMKALDGNPGFDPQVENERVELSIFSHTRLLFLASQLASDGIQTYNLKSYI